MKLRLVLLSSLAIFLFSCNATVDNSEKIKALEDKIDNLSESLLKERIDYLDIATEIVKAYNLKSRIKFATGNTLAEYVPETDTIYLRKSYPNMKEFIITVLHEIKHALDAKQLGTRKFMKKYTQAGTMAQYKGLDPHDDNRWVERAEKWARNEYKRIKNKLNFQ